MQRSSCTAFKNWRKLLTSGVIFAVNRYGRFMENENIIRTFCGFKPYKQSVEALDKLQDTQNIKE